MVQRDVIANETHSPAPDEINQFKLGMIVPLGIKSWLVQAECLE
jgi:hypothetical protein